MAKKQEKVILDQRALIVNPDGEILIVREEDMDWDLPGGVFDGTGANWRENLEEIIDGLLKLQIIANKPIFATDYLDPSNGEYMYVSFVHAQAFDTDLDDSKFEEVMWVKPSDLGSYQFSTFDVKDAILSYFE